MDINNHTITKRNVYSNPFEVIIELRIKHHRREIFYEYFLSLVLCYFNCEPVLTEKEEKP